MELNGIHNTRMILWKLREKTLKFIPVSIKDIDELLKILETTDRYFTAYYRKPDTKWHDVYQNPDAYETQAMESRRLFKELKEEK